MGQISYTIPTAGSTQNVTADPEVATALQTLLTLVNGNIDLSNMSTTAQQSFLQMQTPGQLQIVVGATVVTTASGPVGSVTVNHSFGHAPIVLATADPSGANSDVLATVSNRSNTTFQLNVYAASQGGSYGYAVYWAAIG